MDARQREAAAVTSIPLPQTAALRGRAAQLAAVLCAAVLLLAGCGKNREISPEEIGTPTTMPYEQVLYRDAQATLRQWLKAMNGETPLADAYGMLTAASRQRLKAQGVGSGRQFAAWFDKNRQDGQAPFYIRFSRVDIIDTDIGDTARAVLTASLLVDFHTQSFQSVSSFILLRERGSWKVPFAESDDHIRSWWQQDRPLTARVADDGLVAFSSRALHLSLRYPASWDVSESKAMPVPGEAALYPGIEISYTDPATGTREALVRIWTLAQTGTAEQPQAAAAPARTDTAATAFTLEEQREAQLREAVTFAGKRSTLLDAAGRRRIVVFAGVNGAAGGYANYAETLAAILASLAPAP
jgi:hypothetical protein